MKVRLLWFLALSGLVAMGASGCDEDLPSSSRSLSGVPEEHQAAWTSVETVTLVLDELYEKEDEPCEASIRPAMSDVLEAAGLSVTEEGEADAQLSITVSGEQSPARPAGAAAAGPQDPAAEPCELQTIEVPLSAVVRVSAGRGAPPPG
jgi:hypothetical protein